MASKRKVALLVSFTILIAVMALLYWPSDSSDSDHALPQAQPARSAVALKDVFLALMPLAIGLTAIGFLRGWIVLRDKHTRQPLRISGFFRLCVLGCAILSTFAGVAGVLHLAGILDAALRR
jgi:hypothetical protein